MSYRHKSWALTINPTYLDEDMIKGVTAWIKRQCKYWHIITEKKDERRHIHAGCFWKDIGISRKYLNQALKGLKCFEDCSSADKWQLGEGTKIMYNSDWLDKYMDKADDTVVINSNIPEKHHLEHFWPTAIEQTKAKQKALINKATDKYYAKLEQMWYQYRGPSVEINYENVAMFMSDMMFSARLLRVNSNTRKLSATIMCLVKYLNKDTKFVPINYYKKELQFL